MNRAPRFACRLPLILLVVLTLGTTQPARAFEEGYGSVTGQFVLDGKIPEPKLVFKANDPKVKDGEVCAAQDRYSNSLVVDEKTKGIAHIFIYKRRAEEIHPDLAESKVKELAFDQKNCTFKPHSLVVRTDQTVRVLSDDPIAHNTHTFPIVNQAVNFLLKPNDREGIPVKNPLPEILPIQVKCDIHTWMLAHWLILDHPYAAVTDNKGQFRIDLLPAGEHEFRVWHERVGYVQRSFKVSIKSDATTKLEPVKVPLERFQE